MMRQKMMTINDAYIEAAVIDGASMWLHFFQNHTAHERQRYGNAGNPCIYGHVE